MHFFLLQKGYARKNRILVFLYSLFCASFIVVGYRMDQHRFDKNDKSMNGISIRLNDRLFIENESGMCGTRHSNSRKWKELRRNKSLSEFFLFENRRSHAFVAVSHIHFTLSPSISDLYRIQSVSCCFSLSARSIRSSK